MLFNQVDLTPTILGLLGAAIPDALDGKDWSATLRGDASAIPPFVAFINVPYIDKSETPNRPMFEKGEERCIVSGPWKLILSTRRPPELYDLDSDPTERKNLWPKMLDSSEVNELLAHLAEWSVSTGDALAPKLLQSLQPPR